jgi:ABC-type multidrug transport system ATPase subunit
MVGEPPLLLLDEPTSGLDSITCLRIAELLKREAKENARAVICTIHQPQAKIFFSFDRIIFLSEGHMIFNGPPKDAIEHFKQFGV